MHLGLFSWSLGCWLFFGVFLVAFAFDLTFGLTFFFSLFTLFDLKRQNWSFVKLIFYILPFSRKRAWRRSCPFDCSTPCIRSDFFLRCFRFLSRLCRWNTIKIIILYRKNVILPELIRIRIRAWRFWSRTVNWPIPWTSFWRTSLCF